MLETIEKMVAWTTKPLSAIPNAGLPATVEGRNIYLCSPEYMAQYARRLLQTGVRIVGGCCGTSPEHIKAIRSEARSLQPAHAQSAVSIADHGRRTAPRAGSDAESARGRKERPRSQAGRGQVRSVRGNSAAARRRRFERNRGRQTMQRRRNRLHQCSRWPPRQRPPERAGHLPADSAARRDRGRTPFLLPRP